MNRSAAYLDRHWRIRFFWNRPKHVSTLSLRAAIDESFQLSWGKPSDSGHLQKIEVAAIRLTQARRAIERVQPPDEVR